MRAVWGTLSLLAGDVVCGTESLRPREGLLPVPRIPLVPDADLLDVYALTNPEHRQWWHARLARVRTELHRITNS